MSEFDVEKTTEAEILDQVAVLEQRLQDVRRAYQMENARRAEQSHNAFHRVMIEKFGVSDWDGGTLHWITNRVEFVMDRMSENIIMSQDSYIQHWESEFAEYVEVFKNFETNVLMRANVPTVS